jgi:late competence protein required for DNA uptake (superfamily II DNA/RNA helicase)
MIQESLETVDLNKMIFKAIKMICRNCGFKHKHLPHMLLLYCRTCWPIAIWAVVIQAVIHFWPNCVTAQNRFKNWLIHDSSSHTFWWQLVKFSSNRNSTVTQCFWAVVIPDIFGQWTGRQTWFSQSKAKKNTLKSRTKNNEKKILLLST